MKIILVGAAGQMGQRVIAVAAGQFDITGVDKKLDSSSIAKVKVKADVVLDFSTTEATSEVIKYCEKNRLPLVSAVTGHSEKQISGLRKLSKVVPVLWGSNFSVGIYLMRAAAKMLAQKLEGFDINLVEIHHKRKKDAPSGTCKTLYEDLRSVTAKSEISTHSLRGGSVVGTHSVLFLGEGEEIEVKHTATSRDIFAKGALKACEWLAGKATGWYTMEDFMK